MKNSKPLKPENLRHINKSNSDLIQLLSPEITASNQELFYRKSSNQTNFSKELRNKGITSVNEKDSTELEDCLEKIKKELSVLFKNNSEIKKSRLDLDIAKIFHRNLALPRMAIIDYDFWRFITLFHFIELVKWRWEKDPTDPSNWNTNAKYICGRALGLTLNKKKYDEDKTI